MSFRTVSSNIAFITLPHCVLPLFVLFCYVCLFCYQWLRARRHVPRSISHALQCTVCVTTFDLLRLFSMIAILYSTLHYSTLRYSTLCCYLCMHRLGMIGSDNTICYNVAKSERDAYALTMSCRQLTFYQLIYFQCICRKDHVRLIPANNPTVLYPTSPHCATLHHTTLPHTMLCRSINPI